MSVVAVGLNHRTVPLAVLETMNVSAAQMPKALHELASAEHLSEVVVLSTCMRTEIYAVATRYHGAMLDVREFLSCWSGSPPEVFSDHLYSYFEEAAVGHLFRVASGLDSVVVGEHEILGQVRDAALVAVEEGCAGPTLGALFRQAVDVGRRVRVETAIARGTTSLSQAAVSLALSRLDEIPSLRAAIVGAGEIGEATARCLADVGHLEHLDVVNRSHGRAVEIASSIGGVAVEWSSLLEAVRDADLVVTSTGSNDVILSHDDLNDLMDARSGRPLLLVDLAVPRDVDPAAASIAGVTLLDIDDIKASAQAAMEDRRAELPAVEAIVAAEVERFSSISAERALAPLVAEVYDKAEQIRLAELERFSRRLVSLDDRQRRVVEALTRGIVAKLLHTPVVKVKGSAGGVNGESLAEALRHLFDV